MNAAWEEAFATSELAFDEFFVVEILVGQIQVIGFGVFGPAGFFVGTAFGTGFCVGRDFGAAVGANLWCHLRFTIHDLHMARQA